MLTHLYKYLILHKHLTIPKIGIFRIEYASAQIDGTNNLLFPPTYNIRFKQSLANPDRHFYDFLVHETGMELVDAINSLQAFAQKLLAESVELKGAQLSGIGTLKSEQTGQLLFFSDKPISYLFPEVPIQKSISVAKNAVQAPISFKGQELEGDALKEFLGQANDVESGDNWWVYALGLLLLGIGALLFYYV